MALYLVIPDTGDEDQETWFYLSTGSGAGKTILATSNQVKLGNIEVHNDLAFGQTMISEVTLHLTVPNMRSEHPGGPVDTYGVVRGRGLLAEGHVALEEVL